MKAQRLALVLAVAVMCIAGTALAADIPVEWSTDPTPKSITAECGDTITLTWTGNHDVAKASTGDCPLTSATVLAPTNVGGTYKYTVRSTDTTFWLICTVSSHCSIGQNIKVTSTCPTATPPAAGNTTTPTTTNGTTNSTTAALDTVIDKANGGSTYSTAWRPGRKIADLKLTCNDDIRFYWNATGLSIQHDVLLKPYEDLANMNDTCTDMEANNSTKQMLVPLQTIGNYTWQPTENGDYYFICTYGQHCKNGQRVRATVTGCAKTSSIYKPGGVSSTPKKSAAPMSIPVASWLMALVALAAFWAS